MEGGLPKPGETKLLTAQAENLRMGFATWVDTQKDCFVKRDGRALAELVHEEMIAKARYLLSNLGLSKPVRKSSSLSDLLTYLRAFGWLSS